MFSAKKRYSKYEFITKEDAFSDILLRILTRLFNYLFHTQLILLVF